ncbi:MAG: hypothetical protein WC511_06600 [Candidatus Pacearchaeota archaeon]|jgi:hypothetical protein
MSLENIKTALDSEVFKEIKDFLIRNCEELKDIENVKDHGTAVAQALELKAQKKAYLKLKEILLTVLSWEVKEKEEKEDYGL